MERKFPFKHFEKRYTHAVGSYLNFLSDLTFQFIWDKILEHKTPTKRFSLCFIFLQSDEFPGINGSDYSRPVNRHTSSRNTKCVKTDKINLYV